MDTSWLPSWLGPDAVAPLLEAVLEGRAEGPEGGWQEVGPRVWSFPLFSAGACERLLEEIARRRAGSRSTGRNPNSMHAYGTALDDLDLGSFAQDLRRHVVMPLAGRWFADLGGGELQGQYGFLAEYGLGADQELGYHVDDSVVTLNICLGDDFSGAELYFRGMRCDAHRQTEATPSENFELEHVPGTAVLHAGRHRHGVNPIRRGSRRNLILWCQSAEGHGATRPCGPWCGWSGLAGR